MSGINIAVHPVPLGLGAKATADPAFTESTVMGVVFHYAPRTT